MTVGETEPLSGRPVATNARRVTPGKSITAPTGSMTALAGL